MAKQSPSLATRAVDERGFFTSPWVRFFTDLIAPAKEFTAFSLGASPATVQPSDDGHVLISGGTVTGVTLRRGVASLTMPAGLGVYPVSAQDELVISYSSLPIVQFIPR